MGIPPWGTRLLGSHLPPRASQEDKEAVFEVSDTMSAVLQVATGVISTLQASPRSSPPGPYTLGWGCWEVILRGGEGGCIQKIRGLGEVGRRLLLPVGTGKGQNVLAAVEWKWVRL